MFGAKIGGIYKKWYGESLLTSGQKLRDILNLPDIASICTYQLREGNNGHKDLWIMPIEKDNFYEKKQWYFDYKSQLMVNEDQWFWNEKEQTWICNVFPPNEIRNNTIDQIIAMDEELCEEDIIWIADVERNYIPDTIYGPEDEFDQLMEDWLEWIELEEQCVLHSNIHYIDFDNSDHTIYNIN